MAAIRSKNTSPELRLRKALFSLGLRYRLYAKDLPGKPDLVFRKRKCVIFVNGCFWHHHEGCPRATVPKSHEEYWLPKIQGNISRDEKHIKDLNNQGFRVLTIWECALKSKIAGQTAALACSWIESGLEDAEITTENSQPLLRRRHQRDAAKL